MTASIQYVTVFDVLRTAFQWQWTAYGLVSIAICLALPKLMRIFGTRKPRWRVTWMPRFLLGFAIVSTLLVLIATSVDYLRATDALRNKKTSVVEGLVTEFSPMPYTGHRLESFVVRGIRFAYADAVITAGFHNTTSHGGPIYEGLPVRIWYIVGSNGPEILRLDVPSAAAR